MFCRRMSWNGMSKERFNRVFQTSLDVITESRGHKAFTLCVLSKHVYPYCPALMLTNILLIAPYTIYGLVDFRLVTCSVIQTESEKTLSMFTISLWCVWGVTNIWKLWSLPLQCVAYSTANLMQNGFWICKNPSFNEGQFLFTFYFFYRI